MTKKDYELIAGVFGNLKKADYDFDEYQIITELGEKLADKLEQDNPRFDRARFLQACGVDTRQPSTISMEQWARNRGVGK